MKIGICGPVFLPMLVPFLEEGSNVDVKGMGGTPVNHQIIALLEQGHEVHVYTVTPELEPGETRYWKGDKLHVHMGVFRKRGRQRTPDLYRQERKFMTSKMLATKPDIVHAHWQYEWGWAALSSGLPVLLTCHDAPLLVVKSQPDLYRVIRLVVATICLRKAKHLTAVAPYTGKGLKPFTKKPVSIIPNFEPDNIFALYKERFDAGDAPKIAMINNGFHDRKNVAVGIQAFVKFSKHFPDAELHLYGSDHGVGQDADKWCQKNNIREKVFFHGELPFNELMNRFAAADIFLHTSVEESCPMVLIEAMAMGIPSVAGQSAGGIPWMLEKGGGILTDIRSADEVYNSLIKLVDKDVYGKTAKEARVMALDRFSKKVVINQYLDEYKKVLRDEGVAYSF